METLGKTKNFLAIEEEYSNYENSRIVILPVPYEVTTSYGKGTRKGPRAILKASAYVEFYDDETKRELCFEKGIATVKPLQFDYLNQTESLSLIEKTVETILKDGKFLVAVGGEHTITLPVVKPFFERFPNMTLLQFDAHSDLRNIYEENPFSHACVMSRIIEFFPPEKLFQVGIRALSIEEAELIDKMKIKTYFAWKIKQNLYGSNWISRLVESLSDQIYITFDVDYFDPSVMPSTGTPEPDGFSYSDAISIMREIVAQGKKIIGFDVVELAPIKKLHYPDLTIARLIYKMLNYTFTKE